MRKKVLLLVGMLIIGFAFLSKGSITYAIEGSNTGNVNETPSYFFIYYNGGEQLEALSENVTLTLTGWTNEEAKTSANGKIEINTGTSSQIKDVTINVTDELNKVTLSENESIYFRLVESESFKVEEKKPLQLNNQITVVTENKNGSSIEEVKTIDEYGTVIKKGFKYYLIDESNQKVEVSKEQYDSLNSTVDTSAEVETIEDPSIDSKNILNEVQQTQEASTFNIMIEDPEPSVKYSTHVQNIGWQNEVSDGKMSGTEGKALRLEAIKISLENAPESWGITYKTHVQYDGWQSSVSNGAISGTSGESKRLEAIQINLNDEMAKHYDVYYRVHAESYGWLDWAKNGESAGTQGLSKRLEAIEIKLVEKGGAAPGPTNKPFIFKDPSVVYSTHIQNIGWQEPVTDGKMAGTKGKTLRMEAIKISLENAPFSGAISYRTHVQDYGWLNSVSNGTISGSTGEGKRVEAIQINLTDEMAEHYDVYYRVHAEHYGWLEWAKNGGSAGTEGLSKRLEAIEIKLVKKGGAAPGPTSRAFIKGPSVIYSTNVQSIGWQESVSNGKMAGTEGQALQVEALKISLKDTPYLGGITYKTHVQDFGWLDSTSDGAISGTVGGNKRVEAIQINLTGEMANYYDIYYRVHIGSYGWLGWAKNGMSAGSEGLAKPVEAIEIKLISKGQGESVSESDSYKQPEGTRMFISSVSLPVYRSYEELADYRLHLDMEIYNPGYTRYSTLGYGDIVNVLEIKNYAAKIQTIDGLVGWVHKDYLETSLTDDWWLVKEWRTLRSKPDVKSSSIGKVGSGAKVYLLEHESTADPVYPDWYYIQTESGQKGWIWGAATTSGNSGYNVIKYNFNQEGKISNQVDIFTPLNTKTNVTADQINAFINYKTGGKTTLMTDMGQTYLTAQEESGLNGIYLFAHSGLETGWGTSAILKDKYNFYGIGAIDSKPAQGAYTFDSPEGGIIAGSIWIRDNYVVRPGDTDDRFPYYPQPTIDNMRNDNSWHQYATDESWAAKIGYFAKEFYNFITGK